MKLEEIFDNAFLNEEKEMNKDEQNKSVKEHRRPNLCIRKGVKSNITIKRDDTGKMIIPSRFLLEEVRTEENQTEKINKGKQKSIGTR